MSNIVVAALMIVAFLLLASGVKKFLKFAIAVLIFAGIFILHNLGIF